MHEINISAVRQLPVRISILTLPPDSFLQSLLKQTDVFEINDSLWKQVIHSDKSKH